MEANDHRKLILHIGAHKTGTSAIQNFLLRRKDELASKGWFYCERPGRPTNWGHMFKVQREAEGATFPIRPLIFSNMLGLMDSGLPDVIFSAEDLFFLGEEDVKIFADQMAQRFEDIVIVCYVRRQDIMTVSQWAQGGKTVQSALIFGGVQGPLQNINRHMLRYLDYSGRLDVWQAALPQAKLIVRIYDRELLPNRNVVEDFLNVTGLAIEADAEDDDANATYGATTVQFVYLLRAAGLYQKPIEAMMNDKLIPITTDKLLPSQSEAREFVGLFSDSNEKLARALGTSQAFSDDYSHYPEVAGPAPLDPDFVRDNLLLLLVDTIKKLEACQKKPET